MFWGHVQFPFIPDQFRQKQMESLTPIPYRGLVGVRDCPYGICCPWVRGGRDLDALGKFFRRRRRPRPLRFRQILENSRYF